MTKNRSQLNKKKRASGSVRWNTCARRCGTSSQWTPTGVCLREAATSTAAPLRPSTCTIWPKTYHQMTVIGPPMNRGIRDRAGHNRPVGSSFPMSGWRKCTSTWGLERPRPALTYAALMTALYDEPAFVDTIRDVLRSRTVPFVGL